MYQRILVAVDGSRPSSLALDQAIKLAGETGAKVQIMHAVDESPIASPEAPSAIFGEVATRLFTDGTALLEAAKSRAQRAGVEAETVLLEEKGYTAGKCIVQQAEQWHADLIVCGTHGRRGIRRLLVGSDAEYVVRHMPVPVLVVGVRE